MKLKINKLKLKNWKKILITNTREFCNNSSIHGLKYFTNNDLNSIERIYFMLAFCSVVILLSYFIINVYVKWSTTPVIFGVNPKETSITAEPFPAVTICNLNQAYKSKVEQYSIYSTEYAMLQMLCKRDVNVTIADTIKDWSILENFIADISQPCSNMLLTCRYGAIKYNCSELFRSLITEEGLCCTFNMVHPAYMYFSGVENSPVNPNETGPDGYKPVRWSAEFGYPKDLPQKFYPRPAVGIGESFGLSVSLDVEADTYYCSSANSIGFKIALHNPSETPRVREIGLLLAAGSETKIRIHTEKTESEYYLRNINKRYRMCYFQSERQLRLFTEYSESNCAMECIANMLLNFCGCISHFLPKFYGNETICSIYDATCVERIRLKSMLSDTNQIDCSETCLPSCFDLSFMADFSSSPLSHAGFFINNLSSAYMQRNIAIVHIYFNDHSFRSNIQTEFVSGITVLSRVGGLIGLFCGFSFISLSEIIFYGLCRPFRSVSKAKVLPLKQKKHALGRPYIPLSKRLRKPFKNPFKTQLDYNRHLEYLE